MLLLLSVQGTNYKLCSSDEEAPLACWNDEWWRPAVVVVDTEERTTGHNHQKDRTDDARSRSLLLGSSCPHIMREEKAFVCTLYVTVNMTYVRTQIFCLRANVEPI